MNLSLHLAICGVLTAILVVSFVYRKFIDDHDDHNIHLSNSTTDVRTINLQVEHGKRIDMLDKLNKYLCFGIIAYLAIVGGIAAYTGWIGTP